MCDLADLVERLARERGDHDGLDGVVEPVARFEVEAVLLGEREGERATREVPAFDEDLAQAPARLLLLFGERFLQDVVADEPLVHEEPPERSPGARR